MEEEHETAIILVIWRGQKLNVEVYPETTLRDFGQKLQHLTNVKPDTIRLLLPKTLDNSSKMLSPFSDEHSTLSLQDFSLLEGKSIRMMGVSEDEIEEVTRNVTKADMRIAGFDEEEKRLRQRSSNRPQASPKLPQGEYIFCDFRTLQLPGIELNPPASEALRRMHMLAADPGIVAIMNKHRWRVGIMTEMAPVGYVGVSPKCILGFNKNHGEEISLRLRTDDLKGFRKYESIKKTLLHELAHMVYSEHDAHFYALDSQLNQEAAQLDWTKSRGHTLSGHKPSDYFDEEYNVEASTGGPQKLGGVTSDQLATARASSVAAAYRRLADISANSLTVHEVLAEPDPDDSILEQNLLVENSKAARSDGNWELNQKNDSDKQEKIADQNASFIGEAMEAEPYSHITGHKIMSEPDPDDSEMAEGPSHSTHKIMSEPDPDDSEMAEALSHSTTNGQFLGPKICGEPDPDDCETANVALVNRAAEPDPDDSLPNEKVDVEAQLRNSAEPDPDDSQSTATGEDTTKVSTANEEPDPDDSMVKTTSTEHENRAEPDPDDSQGNLVIQHEPYPDDPELQHIQDPVSVVCTRLQKAIDTLKSEVNPMEATSILQTLFKIIRNVIENPSETKFKRLRKANPHFQRNVANYKAAMEVLHLVGFNEDTVSDEIGRSETYLVLKRNDPGLLWLAKSSLEMCIAY